jgi:hypothetical protein
MLDDFRTHQKVMAIPIPPPAALAALATWR